MWTFEAGLALHNDLIEQARALALREPKKPRQASLRRAASTVYYALFHMLLHEATRKLFPSSPSGLRYRAGRAFAHAEMKNVCRKFVKSTGGIADLTTSPIEPELAEIAASFVDLQQARHDADYNLAETFDRIQALAYIDRVQGAMKAWKAVSHTPNANVFLAALLLDSRGNKR